MRYEDRTMMIRNARIAYPHLFEPRMNQNKTAEEYSCALILDPDEPSTEKLLELVEKVAIDRFGPKAPRLLENKRLKHPVHDGDEKEDDEAFAGKYYVNCKSRRQPEVVDQSVQPILDPDEVFGGCYVNVTVGLYAYDQEGGKGVGVGLNNVQLIEKGDRITGAKSAAEEFEALDDEGKKPGRTVVAKVPRKVKAKAKYEEEEEIEDSEEFEEEEEAPKPKTKTRRPAKAKEVEDEDGEEEEEAKGPPRPRFRRGK